MKHHEHRGVSLGTIIMVVLTAAVLCACAGILPKLMGSANIRMDATTMLSALNLTEALPALALSDIPINDVTAVPDMTASPIPTHTPAPTAAPPTASPTPQPGGTLTLTIGGSVDIDDTIRKSAYYSDSKKYDFTDILAPLQGEMQSDLTILSLDNLTDASSKVSALNAPESVMDMLEIAGVDMVALGFSKAYDKGIGSLQATINAAADRGLTTIGAYASKEDADMRRTLTINNVQIAFLHYADNISSTSKKNIKNDGTAYLIPMTDADVINADIAAVREAGADIVVVFVNWGSSSFKVSAKVKTLAQQIADAGADVIVGTGTPSVQTVTWLTGKRADGSIRQTLCAWSMGSLVNGERNDGNVAGMLLQLQLSYDGASVNFERVSYTPTYIWRFKQDGQYQYRVTASDREPPDGMNSDHVKYMEKALKNIQKVLADSPVTLRDE